MNKRTSLLLSAIAIMLLFLRLPAAAQKYVFQSAIVPPAIDRPIALGADTSGNLWITGNNRVEKFDAARNLVLTLGSGYNGAGGISGNPGAGNGQFNAPQALATDSTNNLYVADTYNHRVQKFDPNGNLLMAVTNGSNFQPISIAIDNSDNIFIVDSFTGKLQEYSASGSLLKDIVLPTFNYYSPAASCVAIGPDGSIYVGANSNSYYLMLYLLDPNGSMIANAIRSNTSSVTGITVDFEGTIYVQTTYGVRRMDAFMTAFNGFFSDVSNVAADNNGAVFAAKQGQITRIDASASTAKGVITADTTDAAFSGISSPTVDRQGNIYFITGKNNNVKKFDRTGHFLGFFPDSQTQGVGLLLTDATGHILLVGNPNTQTYDTAGNLLSTAPTVPGPASIDRQGNHYTSTYYVSTPYYHGPETYYLRVAKYDAVGNLLQTFPDVYQATVEWNGGYLVYYSPPSIPLIDSQGNIYIFSPASGVFLVFNQNGQIARQFSVTDGDSGYSYYGLNVLIDNQDRIYVADSDNSNIRIYDTNGNLLTKFGQAGSGAGQFQSIGGISLDDRGNLYVANTGNNRLDIFATTTNVTGHITLDGVSSLTGAAIPLDNLVMQFRASGTTNVLFTRTVPITPDAANPGKGVYLADNVPPGTYDIAFKTVKNLQVVARNISVSGVGYGPDIFLPGGDATNDNMVDIADFGLLVNSYNGDINNVRSGYDARADFNYDGKIDIADFGLLVNNYGNMGDN